MLLFFSEEKWQIQTTSLQLTRDRAGMPGLLARAPRLPGAPGHQEKCKWSCCLAPGKRLGESNLEDEAGLRDLGTSIHPHEEVDSLRKAGCLQATVLRLNCMSESLEDALKPPEPEPHPRSTKLQPPGRDAGICVWMPSGCRCV